jgi:hypothetical protein
MPVQLFERSDDTAVSYPTRLKRARISGAQVETLQPDAPKAQTTHLISYVVL